MRKLTSCLAILASAVMLVAAAGCFSMNPATDEVHSVYPVRDDTRSVTFKKSLTLYDSKAKVYSVSIPAGIYVLEAQDDNYWYFACPIPLERAAFHDDGSKVSDMFSGGFMLEKNRGMLVPAGIYLSDGSMNFTMVWKLGSDFMDDEGRAWKRSR
jgi:hypothetical protein